MDIEDLIAEFREDIKKLEEDASVHERYAAYIRKKAAQFNAAVEYLLKEKQSQDTECQTLNS